MNTCGGCGGSMRETDISEDIAPRTVAAATVTEEIAVEAEPEIVPWFKCWKCGVAILLGILLSD